MAVAFGPASVLFLVAWHVATYLSVQVAEVSTSFFEWIGWPMGKRGVRKMTLGLTVAGIILSTLHQGALGALFTYAPGKVHPLWYSASFQWLHFFVSSLPGGLCMVIAVTTIAIKTMAWRCDDRFKSTLDKLTITLSKGAAMGLATYFTIKLIGVAHDNEWSYFATGWGAWYIFEMAAGVVLPLMMFVYAIPRNAVAIARVAAFITCIGVILNRLNTAIISFNWKLPYREIPHWREVIITVTIYAIFIVVYRAILYRFPILYKWKEDTALEAVTVPSKSGRSHEYRDPSAVATYSEAVEAPVSISSYSATGLSPDESGRRGL